VGLAGVMGALEMGEVETLLISNQELGPAAECTNCGHLMPEAATKCEICNQQTRIFDSATECLLRRIIATNNIDLEILHKHPQLEGLGGIAAQLRFRADQSTPQKLAS
jgi:peptide subunit release factor 1 (eRF1)